MSSSGDHLALALEAAQLGTWTWDMESGTTEWDARLEVLHGLAPGTFGGTFDDWLACLYPDDRASCLRTVQQALAERGRYVLLHRTIWPDGSIHWIECQGLVQVDETGNPIGTTGVAQDVTHLKRQEAAVNRERAAVRDLVETLQDALLPTTFPATPGLRVAGRYLATTGATPMGGDWYAVVPLPEGRVGLGIGDVAGHGLSAVADMAAARFSLRALALGETRPDRVLSRLDQVVTVFGNDTMITALYGILDPATRTWSFATAGHHPAVVRSSDGKVRFLDHAPDPPIGLGGSFHEHHVDLDDASTLVLYTDGLIERRAEPIGDGQQRLLAAVANGPTEPDELCDHLLAHLLHDTANEDDVGLLVATFV